MPFMPAAENSPATLAPGTCCAAHNAWRDLRLPRRNNHFSTLLKHEGQLYILVTDEGFLYEPGAWMRVAALQLAGKAIVGIAGKLIMVCLLTPGGLPLAPHLCIRPSGPPLAFAYCSATACSQMWCGST